MRPHGDELQLRRGRLLERIAVQRTTLARDAEPLGAALRKTDQLISRVRAAADYLQRHPGFAALGTAALLVMRGGSLVRWGKRGFFAWRIWRVYLDKMTGIGWRAR